MFVAFVDGALPEADPGPLGCSATWCEWSSGSGAAVAAASGETAFSTDIGLAGAGHLALEAKASLLVEFLQVCSAINVLLHCKECGCSVCER